MIMNEILREKNRVQKELSESAQDIHDYFVKSHELAQAMMKKYKFPTKKRQKPIDENLQLSKANEDK